MSACHSEMSWNSHKTFVEQNTLTFRSSLFDWTKHVPADDQYGVWPPLALMTAWHLRLMVWMSRLTAALGMLPQAWRMACCSCAAIAGLGRIWLSSLWRWSQKCSIGFKSGLSAGQAMVWTLWRWRKSWMSLAACARALSCWKTKFPWA